MTEDELLATELEERRRLVELSRRTGERRFLEAAAKLRGRSLDRASLLDGPSTPSRRGPKKGSKTTAGSCGWRSSSRAAKSLR